MKGDDLDKALKSLERYVEKLKVKNENLKKEREVPLKVRNAIKYAVMNEAPIRKPTTLGDVTVETGLYPIEDSFEVGIHDKISVKHRLKRSEMTKYVCNGAKLKCPHLDGILKLNVFEERLIFVKHEPIATGEDCKKENFSIDFFSGTGKCSKREDECLKCIDVYWEEETLAPYVFLNGARPVLETSILKCRVDKGIDIEVIENGQDFGTAQGIKNLLLNFHDENPWLIRVMDGQINMYSGLETEALAVTATCIHPHLAVELDKSAGEDFFTGYEQYKEGLINSPLGFIYKPMYKYISDPLRKFIWGDNYSEKEGKSSDKNILEEEKNELKNEVVKGIAENQKESKQMTVNSFTVKSFKEYVKGRTIDKIVEYRKPIYDFATKKNNDIANIVQILVPTKEWSDNTVDFLKDSYITVIIENK